jgi:hypothetical protein
MEYTKFTRGIQSGRISMKTAMQVLVCLAAAFALAAAQNTGAPSVGDRLSVDLTVYNQNIALVREERTVSLATGTSRLVVPDIPATIDGTSLHFRSLTEPEAVRVLEQNYQYDLVHQAKLLEKYLGREIQFVRVNPETSKEYTITGRLISTGWIQQPSYAGTVPGFSSVGGMVVEVGGKLELNPAGRLVLPSLPEGLVLRPQLEWLLTNSRQGQHRVEMSYLAGQLNWSCNYVALIGKDDTRLDLTGWVTLTNTSGTAFRNAGLKLVAGDVNLLRQEGMDESRMAKTMVMAAEADREQFKQTDLFEYKLYSLQRRADLNNNETKQIELTSGRDVASKKVLIYDGLADQWQYWRNNYSYRSQGSFGQQSNPKVGVFVTFRNEQKAGLGIPLPKGKVRVYKRDTDGKEQFIGEDRIDHTPKDEEVRLYLGNAFDVVGERAQKDFKSFASGRVVEETIEVKVRNHKDETVDILVYEHPWRWSQWEITTSTAEWEKVDQSTLKFPLRIPKDGEKVARYTIRYSW